MTLSNQAMLEISELSSRAETLARGNPSDKAVASVLLGRIASIRQSGFSSDEMRQRYSTALVESVSPDKRVSQESYTRAFHSYVRSVGDLDRMSPVEKRDLLAGQQSISYTNLSAVGAFVDIITERDMKNAYKQTDRLLDEAVCDFQISDTPAFNPKVLFGLDLSSVTASLVSEGNQQVNPQFPNALAKTLRSNITMRWSSSASIEWLQDASASLPAIAEAGGTALARLGGQLCVTGDGSAAQPQGILTAITSRSYTTGPGKITLDDLTGIFFSLDRFWRERPKTGFLMSDSVLRRCKEAVDAVGQPLLRINDENQETIFNKPVYVTPSLPAVGGSLGLNSEIIFGDLSAFHVRMSRPQIQVAYNSDIVDITSGRALLTCRARIDSVYIDASSGNSPAIIAATVLS